MQVRITTESWLSIRSSALLRDTRFFADLRSYVNAGRYSAGRCRTIVLVSVIS